MPRIFRDRPAAGRRAHRPGRGAYALVLLYVVGVAIADAVTPQDVRLDAYAAAAPMVAAALCTYGQTVFVAAADLTAMVIIHGVLPEEMAGVNRFAAVFGNVLIVTASIAVARLRRERESLLERVRRTGETAQRALLRELPLRTADATVHGFYISAQQDALVGGDIYEALETPYGTRLTIGDVQGKGLGALGTGSAVLTAFREAAYHRRSLESVVVAMEEGLYRHYRSADERGDDRFVTALVFGTEQSARATRPDGERAVTLSLVACGHGPAYVLGADGTVRELAPDDPGLPLGLGELGERVRRGQRVELSTGCRLLACTDGVTEARDAAGEFYPLAARLDRWAALPSPELLRRLKADLLAYTRGRLDDDVAVLVLDPGAWTQSAPEH